jgi:2-oxoglutarate decarboxylase
MAVVNCTTAAQYFHVLRAQVHRSHKVPLVIMTPKSLLRARVARSKVDELTSGSFAMVLDDPSIEDPSQVRRIVLCSGKVAYDAMARRDAEGGPGPKVAVVRVEQLYPWPEERIGEVLAGYPLADEVTWLQEEPANMGAWSFAHQRLHRILRDDYVLSHAARAESASPAVGSAGMHQLETDDILARALGGLAG